MLWHFAYVYEILWISLFLILKLFNLLLPLFISLARSFNMYNCADYGCREGQDGGGNISPPQKYSLHLSLLEAWQWSVRLVWIIYHFLSLYSFLPWANDNASKTKHKGVFSRKTSNHNWLHVWFWGVILWHIDGQCWRPCSYQNLMNNFSNLFSVITHLVVLSTHSLILRSKYCIICWIVQKTEYLFYGQLWCLFSVGAGM